MSVLAAPATIPHRLHRGVVLLMSTTVGFAVASNYYIQPLLALVRDSLHMSTQTAGLVVTVAQVGYALGLLFLLPLADLVERRRLVIAMTVATALALLVMANARSAPVLLAAAAGVGIYLWWRRS